MTHAMEFHDSILLDYCVEADGNGYLLFLGSVYRSEGTPFMDAQESGWQHVRFVFRDMRIEGEIVALDEYASDGELSVDGENENGTATIGHRIRGRVCMELCLSPNFETVKIHASEVSSLLEGKFEIEFLWDAEGNFTRKGRNGLSHLMPGEPIA